MYYIITKNQTIRKQFRIEANDPDKAEAKARKDEGEIISANTNESYAVRIDPAPPTAK